MTKPTPTLESLPAAEPVYSPEQLTARRQTARMRAAAMVSDWDSVAGLRIHALTPRTHSRLVALGSPFLYGSAVVTQADVRDYLWAHWPDFADDETAGRSRAAFGARVAIALAPPWRRWRHSRTSWGHFVAAGYALAASEIRELVGVAFADSPPPRGDESSAPVASLEAQFVDYFAALYQQWPLETQVRDTPLRVLYQLMRCQSGIDYDAAEAEIIAEDLRKRNESALAAKQ